MVREGFRKFAAWASGVTGSVGAFVIALVVIGTWAITGPVFQFSDTWQLFINTGTTIVTFLMVFLIQNTQNRDSRAIHAKLDELIIHASGADNHIVEAEDLSDDELDKLRGHFQELANSVGGSAGGRRRTKTAAASKQTKNRNGARPKTSARRHAR
jgi:low affinity Fe/Cu permease